MTKITPSKFRGVSWNKRRLKWAADITIDGKTTHLGNFDDEETAARKFDEHAARLGRPLNFPSEGQAQVKRLLTSHVVIVSGSDSVHSRSKVDC